MEKLIDSNLQKLSLEELAIQSQGGNRQAYDAFLKKLSPYIKGAIQKKLGSIVDQQDILQECLIGIHKSLGTYQPGHPIKPWISAIIRYKLADHFRKISRNREILAPSDEIDVTDAPDPTNYEGETKKREAAEVLDKLPENLRRAIELTHIDGLSYSKAADQEGISEVALRKRISRGFSQIRSVVAKEMEI